jgi:hypothetical protein
MAAEHINDAAQADALAEVAHREELAPVDQRATLLRRPGPQELVGLLAVNASASVRSAAIDSVDALNRDLGLSGRGRVAGGALPAPTRSPTTAKEMERELAGDDIQAVMRELTRPATGQ